jgi:hypothetical protein
VEDGGTGFFGPLFRLGLLLSCLELVLVMLLLCTRSLSLQLMDALDFGILCWILWKPTLQLDIGVYLCGGSTMFDDARDCLWWCRGGLMRSIMIVRCCCGDGLSWRHWCMVDVVCVWVYFDA